MPRILVVDDSPPTLAGMCELLERAGYEVVPAGSFEQGRLLAAEIRPDMLLIDVRLGEYNGLHLLVMEKLKNPDVSVIMMSGYDDPVLRAEAKRYGAEFLLKPIQGAHLIGLIRALLDDRSRSTEPT
jgi:two-component system, response regulator RegA